jgi:hypothetical protein
LVEQTTAWDKTKTTLLNEIFKTMEPLEREILNRLAKAREHEETNTNLNTIWRECGGVTPRDFAQAWGSLAAGELVHGEIYESAENIEGLGKITTQGQEALKA